MVCGPLYEAWGTILRCNLLSVPLALESLKGMVEIDALWETGCLPNLLLSTNIENNIDVVRTNLEALKFTLAVPKYVFDAGRDRFFGFVQIVGKEFRQRKIYGNWAGAPANQKLQNMIDTNDFDSKN